MVSGRQLWDGALGVGKGSGAAHTERIPNARSYRTCSSSAAFISARVDPRRIVNSTCTSSESPERSPAGHGLRRFRHGSGSKRCAGGGASGPVVGNYGPSGVILQYGRRDDVRRLVENCMLIHDKNKQGSTPVDLLAVASGLVSAIAAVIMLVRSLIRTSRSPQITQGFVAACCVTAPLVALLCLTKRTERTLREGAG